MASIDQVGAFERRVRALVDGFVQEFPPSEQEVYFGGRKTTAAGVVAMLKQVQEVLEAVHRTDRAFRQAVADRRKAMKSHRATYEDAVFFLKHHLGRENPRLASFGVALPKPRRRLSTEAKAIARAKAAATRKARGTMGKKQRMALGRASGPTLQVFGADGQPLIAVEEAVPSAESGAEGVDPSATREPEGAQAE